MSQNLLPEPCHSGCTPRRYACLSWSRSRTHSLHGVLDDRRCYEKANVGMRGRRHAARARGKKEASNESEKAESGMIGCAGTGAVEKRDPFRNVSVHMRGCSFSNEFRSDLSINRTIWIRDMSGFIFRFGGYGQGGKGDIFLALLPSSTLCS
jgi:hypothetical protein